MVEKEKSTFFHIQDLREHVELIELFVPRVPASTGLRENTEIPRICTARKIEWCCEAHPTISHYMKHYLHDLNYYCPYEHMSKLDFLVYEQSSGRIVRVYHLEVDSEDVLETEKIKRFVPDAHLTNECWIMKPVKPVKVTYAFVDYCLKKKQFIIVRESETLEELGLSVRADDFHFFLENKNIRMFGPDSYVEYDWEKRIDLIHEFLIHSVEENIA